MNNDRVIGFSHSEGYCIRCGTKFSYNGLHPESECQDCNKLPKDQTTLRPKRSYCHDCGSHETIERKTSNPKTVEVFCKGCNYHLGFRRKKEKVLSFTTTIKARFWNMKMQDLKNSLTQTFVEYKEDKEFWNKRLKKLIKLNNYPIPAVFLEGNKPHYVWVHRIVKVRTSEISSRYRDFIETEMCWAITCSPLKKIYKPEDSE